MAKIWIIATLLVLLFTFGCTTPQTQAVQKDVVKVEKPVQAAVDGDLAVLVGTEFRLEDGTVTNEDGGKVVSEPLGIDCPNVCAKVYSVDSNVVLTAKVNAGWKFVGWSGACLDANGPSCTINKAKAIRGEGDKYTATTYALFQKMPPIQTAITPARNLSGTWSGTVTYVSEHYVAGNAASSAVCTYTGDFSIDLVENENALQGTTTITLTNVESDVTPEHYATCHLVPGQAPSVKNVAGTVSSTRIDLDPVGPDVGFKYSGFFTTDLMTLNLAYESGEYSIKGTAKLTRQG